jgi:hypothetical protein
VGTRQTAAVVVATAVVLFGGAPAGAQIETYKGAPPASSPDSRPSPPGDRPASEPAPGKPRLVPAPGQTDEAGRVAGPRTTVLGLTPMTAALVGLGLAGLLVLVFARLRRPPGESDARAKSGYGDRDDRAA